MFVKDTGCVYLRDFALCSKFFVTCIFMSSLLKILMVVVYVCLESIILVFICTIFRNSADFSLNINNKEKLLKQKPKSTTDTFY